MDETRQINLCIDEMAKLKEKMEALEKQKILNEKNELLKKTTMEPNLKVLEDWVVKFCNLKQQKIIEKNISKKWACHHPSEIPRRYRAEECGDFDWDNLATEGDIEPIKVIEEHIQATYNMFNIINKRLDDIEKKLGINN